MSADPLSPFALLVARTARDLGENAYGVTIRARLCRMQNHSVSLGAVYVALWELEERDVLRGQEEEGGPERSGRPKRYYYPGPRYPEEVPE